MLNTDLSIPFDKKPTLNVPGLGAVVVVKTMGGRVVTTGSMVVPIPNVEFMIPGISQYGFWQHGKSGSVISLQYWGMGG